MKESQIKSFFDELLNSQDKMGEFGEILERSMGFFQEVVGTLKDATPEEREKINRSLKQVEEQINQEFDKICSKLGVTREDIEKVLADPKNFKPQEWSMLQEFQDKLDNKEKSETVMAPVKKKVLKTKKNWVSA